MKVVYLLSKHGTVKNYVSEIGIFGNRVQMKFTNDRTKALLFEEPEAEDMAEILTQQMSKELVDVEEVVA